MRKIFPALTTLILILVFPTMGWSADYQKGITAYKGGDYSTALWQLEPLAKQGHVRAQFNLGVMYHNGNGVSQNYYTAVKWYRYSCEQKDAEACFNLAFLYDNGQGVPHNYKAAVLWYRHGAQLGDARSQINLAGKYYAGKGIPRDYVFAHMWANIAGSLGNEQAAKKRDFIAKQMTSSQIGKATTFARECIRKHYKGC